MRSYFKEESLIFLIVLVFFSFCPVQPLAKEVQKQKNKLTPQKPRYELKLSGTEFSLLNSSLVLGLNKYGGGVEFDLKMTKEGNDLFWTVTINNPRLIPLLNSHIGEQSADVIRSVDPDKLDDQDKIALKAMKSLVEKVNYAQKNPVRDLIQISGLVVENNEVLFLEGELGKYQITGNKLPELKKTKGKRVVVIGFIKVKDQIEVVRSLEKKENTLELFVMSFCPFSMIAESSLLDFLETYQGKSKPSLEVHYIFYKKKEGERMVFTCLHGEEEIKENLAQMVIRDEYPRFYHEYLLGRVKDESSSWDELAKGIGMKQEDVKSVEQKIEKERETLIQKEYDYVTGTYGIYDGSPSYVWECERVADIRKVDAFKGFEFSSDRCAEEAK